MVIRNKILQKLMASKSPKTSAAVSYYELGCQLASDGNYQEAVDVFKRALHRDVESAETYLELGLAYDRLDRIDDAVEAFSKAVRLKPDFAEAYSNLGLAYDRSAQFLKAVHMHLKAIRLKPDDAKLRKNLGLAYFNIGSYQEAIRAFLQALKLDPEDANVRYHLALVYLDLEDEESAVIEHQRILDMGETQISRDLNDQIDRQRLRSAGSVARRPAPLSTDLAQKISTGQQGFSMIELLVVIAMISILSGFALVRIVRARQVLNRQNAAQQFAAYLEKARLDSLRRHPTATAQMAQVSIINAGFYSVTIDSTGDGALDAPQVMSLPVDSDFQFNGPFPRTIYFNWRGRTVDAADAPADPSFVTISSASYGESRIDLTSAGQPSLDGPPAISPVVNSAAPTPVYRTDTQIP